MHFDDHLAAGYSPAVVDGPATEPVPQDDADPLTGGPDARIDICDTDDDGHADTVAITHPDAGTVLFTDVDGDGRADVATEISGDGVVTVSEHLGDGDWTVVEHSRIGAAGPSGPGPAPADDGSAGMNSAGVHSAGVHAVGFSSAGASAGDGAAAGTGLADTKPVVIDPATGEWTEI